MGPKLPNYYTYLYTYIYIDMYFVLVYVSVYVELTYRCFDALKMLFVGVVIKSAVLFCGVVLEPPDYWRLPYMHVA